MLAFTGVLGMATDWAGLATSRAAARTTASSKGMRVRPDCIGWLIDEVSKIRYYIIPHYNSKDEFAERT